MGRNDHKLSFSIRSAQNSRTSFARATSVFTLDLQATNQFKTVEVSVNETAAEPTITISLSPNIEGQAHLTGAVPHGMHVERIKLRGHFNTNASMLHVDSISLKGYRSDIDPDAKHGVNRKVKFKHGKPRAYGGQIHLSRKEDRPRDEDISHVFSIKMGSRKGPQRLVEQLIEMDLMRNPHAVISPLTIEMRGSPPRGNVARHQRTHRPSMERTQPRMTAR